RVDAIEIDVIEIRSRAAIFMDKRERGAGDIVFCCGSECACNSLHQRGFAGAEITAQQDKFGGSKQVHESATENNSSFCGMRGNFAQQFSPASLGAHSTSIASVAGELGSPDSRGGCPSIRLSRR